MFTTGGQCLATEGIVALGWFKPLDCKISRDTYKNCQDSILYIIFFLYAVLLCAVTSPPVSFLRLFWGWCVNSFQSEALTKRLSQAEQFVLFEEKCVHYFSNQLKVSILGRFASIGLILINCKNFRQIHNLLIRINLNLLILILTNYLY